LEASDAFWSQSEKNEKIPGSWNRLDPDSAGGSRKQPLTTSSKRHNGVDDGGSRERRLGVDIGGSKKRSLAIDCSGSSKRRIAVDGA
jgi:hypothetical protein